MTTVLDKWKAEAITASDCSYSVTQCQRNKTKANALSIQCSLPLHMRFNVGFPIYLTCFNLKDGRQKLRKTAVMPLAQGLD